ncbi:MAG TPA: hypothetical protein VME42_02265 [Steroidobacteraceae bacterium]|nr:hypothetical protein [Steroidobacteraceae bacterium]
MGKRVLIVPRKAAILVGVVMMLSGCDELKKSLLTDPIQIEREVFVPGLYGDRHGAAQLPDGGFVIVGGGQNAWAARTDATGKLLWKYEEPYDPASRVHYGQSEFNDAVSRANGQIWLSGQASTNGYQAGLLVTLDENGKLVQRQLFRPNDEPVGSGSLERIIAWGDGYAITGWGTDFKRSFFWLLKVDANGNKEWDKVRADVVGAYGVALSDGSLVLAGAGDDREDNAAIVRLDSKGKVIARRSIPYPDAIPVQPLDHSDRVRVLAIDGADRNHLFSLDGNLTDERASRFIEGPNIRNADGAGALHNGPVLELPNDSIALFGNLFMGGRVSRASIGRWGSRSTTQVVSLQNPRKSSHGFFAAIRLEANKFVAMRDEIGSGSSGVVLSWVTFN